MTKRDRQRAAFHNWFQTLGVSNFGASELLLESSRRGHKNEIPPKSLWPNIVQTLQTLDALRDDCGYPIVITSAYRDPKYNALVGGAKASQHLKFAALDFTCQYVAPAELFNRLRHYRENRDWIGGLGLYKTFVHIDIGIRQRSATWGL